MVPKDRERGTVLYIFMYVFIYVSIYLFFCLRITAGTYPAGAALGKKCVFAKKKLSTRGQWMAIKP